MKQSFFDEYDDFTEGQRQAIQFLRTAVMRLMQERIKLQDIPAIFRAVLVSVVSGEPL